MNMQHNSTSVTVKIDRDRFISTRNALTNAFVGLSGAIDEAVKAYVNHTNAVLDGVGGSTLDVSGLIQPFNNLGGMPNVAHLAQQAMLQNGNGVTMTPGAQLNPDGTRKKRQYKPRDPNAPKRPLTAYFRYLQEQRPRIQAELQASGPDPVTGKAGDISKIATERWKALPDEKKKPYVNAYKSEMKPYYAAVHEYKKAGGEIDDDDAAAEVDDAISPAQLGAIAQKAEHDDDDDESESSSDDTSDSDEEDEPAPPPKPVKSSSPEAPKKTPKSSLKRTKAGADPLPDSFSSIDPQLMAPAPPPPAEMAPSTSPTRKRKTDTDETDEGSKKKRGRKSKADQDAAAASSQLVTESSQPDASGTEKKKKKKNRKSEPVA